MGPVGQIVRCMVTGAQLFFGGVILALLSGSSSLHQATPTPPCGGAEYRQFDFWLGEWTVEQHDKVVGTSSVTRALGDCVVHEVWTATGRSRGESFNLFDRASRQWVQSWVDNDGQLLLLRGGRQGESMVLEGSRPRVSGGTVIDRITWTPLEGGRVRQHWIASVDGGTTWSDQFDGIYRRRP